MSEMWNKRYAQEEYVYSKEPNAFFKEQLLLLKPGKLLLAAEGEGRNAVFAAKNTWEVAAFDSSIEAKKKAEKLASENGVALKYNIDSFEDVQFEENTFDVIALVYAHTINRQANHQKLLEFLKPGGVLLLEAYSKDQIKNATGGSKKAEFLFSKDELQQDFDTLSEKKVWEEELFLSEGILHVGNSSVIRCIGKK